MKKVLQCWLIHQCRILAGSTQAVLLTGPPGAGPHDQALFWPDKRRDHSVLLRHAETALRNKQAQVTTRNNKPENTVDAPDTLTCPLLLNGRLFGAVAIEMTHRSQPMQAAAVQQVQAWVKWLETMIQQQGSTLELISLALNRKNGTAYCDRLLGGSKTPDIKILTAIAESALNALRIYRTALGALKDAWPAASRAVTQALTDPALNANIYGSFKPAKNHPEHTQRELRVRSLIEAMDNFAGPNNMGFPLFKKFEKFTTTKLVKSTKKSQTPPKHDFFDLCDDLFTLEVRLNAELETFLTDEAHLMPQVEDDFRRKPFYHAPATQQLVNLVDLVATGPVLETRRRDDRPSALKILDSMQSWCARLFGPRHLQLKVGLALSAMLLIWLSQASATFSISSDSVLEAEICRTIVAPQEGYIAEAHVRAGDLVREGDLLATLDDQDLRHEQRKWQSQRAQLFREYRKALAGADRAEVAILSAKRAQAEAQLKLVERQLARAKLVAPFSGLVVKGDLNQALGAPVKRGEVLYEVAPTNEYRVVLKVDDRDIGLVSPGQRGQLKLSGIPDKSVNITIDRLSPVSSATGGRNFFRVEAVMDNHLDLMRPGMEGVAKIDICQEKLLWILTRRWVDRLRLFVWNRLP